MINSKKNKLSRIFKIPLNFNKYKFISCISLTIFHQIYIHIYIYYILQPLKNFNRCLKRSSFVSFVRSISERRNIDEYRRRWNEQHSAIHLADPLQLQISPLRRKFVSRSIIKRIPSLVPLARRGRGKDWQELRGGNRGHRRWIIRPWSIVAAASSGSRTVESEQHTTTVLVAP